VFDYSTVLFVNFIGHDEIGSFAEKCMVIDYGQSVIWLPWFWNCL